MATSVLDADIDYAFLERRKVPTVVPLMEAIAVVRGHRHRDGMQPLFVLDRSLSSCRLDHLCRYQRPDGVDRGVDRHASTLLTGDQTTQSAIECFPQHLQLDLFAGLRRNAACLHMNDLALIAASKLDEKQPAQPDWVRFAAEDSEDLTVARYSHGRWPEGRPWQAPYVRADIALGIRAAHATGGARG